MERLTRIIALCNKFEEEGKLTSEEHAEVVLFVSDLTEMMTQLTQQLIKALSQAAEALLVWWDELPAVTQKLIEQSPEDRMKSRLGPFQGTISADLIGPSAVSLPNITFNPNFSVEYNRQTEHLINESYRKNVQ